MNEERTIAEATKDLVKARESYELAVSDELSAKRDANHATNHRENCQEALITAADEVAALALKGVKE